LAVQVHLLFDLRIHFHLLFRLPLRNIAGSTTARPTSGPRSRNRRDLMNGSRAIPIRVMKNGARSKGHPTRRSSYGVPKPDC